MTDKQFMFCVSEAQNYRDRDAYLSDISTSDIWHGETDADIPVWRIEQIGSIYDAVHRSVHEIALSAGLSHRKLAERFCVPYRTMENWCSGKNECPLYFRLSMQECLSLCRR